MRDRPASQRRQPCASHAPATPAHPSARSLKNLGLRVLTDPLLRALSVCCANTHTHLQAPDQATGVQRAKTYVQGSDKEVLCGFYVHSINEWGISQKRVLVLTQSAYYRVEYSHKTG